MRTTVAALVLGMVATWATAADWPMWRQDAGRTAYTAEELPDELHLLWERQYTPRVPAWEEPLNLDRMPFDRTFEPVAAEGLIYVGFNDADKLVALDAATGEERWTFHTEGPVRLPAAVGGGKVYFACDDGHLYCLDAREGALLWRHRGGPSDRKVLGNGRLISTWPARGAPVLAGGRVYYAAGIWPFMGVFIYALDAETGAVLWENDHTGGQYQLQPHNAPSFAGVAPQGALAVDGDRLLVPGGRSVPACFDRETGAFIHYNFAENNKTGGSFVCAADGFFVSHHIEKLASLYAVETGEALAIGMGAYPVLAGSAWYLSGSKVTALDAGVLALDPKRWAGSRQWELAVDASGDLIGAGGRLYAGGKGRITAVAVPPQGGTPSVAWAKNVPGDVERLLAAEGRLIAVTLDGRIMAFGGDRPDERLRHGAPAAAEPSADAARLALDILDRTGVRDGYALVYGADCEVLEALAVHSDLRVVGVQGDPATVAAGKAHIDAAGLYGGRVALHAGDLEGFEAPPYMASLTVVFGVDGDPDRALRRIQHSMRPYGGKALIFGLNDGDGARVREAALALGLAADTMGDAAILTREGPLEGAGSWTHLLGDVAQTGKSNDRLVRLPLGLLWFGGNSNEDVLPRHGHGPTQQVLGGRLFIEGMNCISARDVYTGRVLWKRTLQEMGNQDVYFSGDAGLDPFYNQPHIPGANLRGTNYVATEDGVYVIQGGRCQVLDAATGETRTVIALPAKDPSARRPELPAWGYIGVYDEYLIAGADFVEFTDLLPAGREEKAAWDLFNKAAGAKLYVLDRGTGEVRWDAEAVHGFLNNGIVAGAGTVFCLDKLPPGIEDQLLRRGRTAPGGYRLLALDIRTGKARWEKTGDHVFGSFLCYAEADDVLVQSTRPSRDSAAGEGGRRMAAYRGSDGALLWDREFPYGTFPVIHGRRILTETGAFDLLTGETVERENPITLAREPWTWTRQYGCNYPIASEHLMTFRSGAAGYFDLSNDGGTGNLGGFKSGCSANLVVADGVLNAPDYTRTCTCSYQNQTSLALVHMPEADVWTFNAYEAGPGRVARVGINLGAPGDRRADDGTLWLDFPSVGGPSPDIPVRVRPDSPAWFARHTSAVEGAGLGWVAASGAEGIESVSLTLAENASGDRPYTVRLHFMEPGSAGPGERVFDVAIQGRTVLTGFDIAAETGGPRRAVVKEFTGVDVRDALTVSLKGAAGSRGAVLCGIEAICETSMAVAAAP